MHTDDELFAVLEQRCNLLAQSHARNKQLIDRELRHAENSLERSVRKLAGQNDQAPEDNLEDLK